MIKKFHPLKMINVSFAQKIFAAVFCLLISFTSFSQTISASLDRDKILLGEQVTLTLKLEDVNPRTSYLNGWINLPDTANHIEVINRGTIDSVELNGYTSYIQNIIITSFDSGKWILPPIQIAVHEKDSEKQTIIKANELSLEVLPVNVSDMKDYHDIKGILDVEVRNNYAVIISIAVITLIAIIALIVLMRYRKKIIIPAKATSSHASLLEWAMNQLQKLQQENLSAKGQRKLFYTRLDEIYREYFDQQLGVHSRNLTSDEMMVRLKVYLQSENVRTQFYQTVRLTDAVKFAKYIPDAAQNDEAIEITKKTIQHIDQLSQRMKMNNAY